MLMSAIGLSDSVVIAAGWPRRGPQAQAPGVPDSRGPHRFVASVILLLGTIRCDFGYGSGCFLRCDFGDRPSSFRCDLRDRSRHFIRCYFRSWFPIRIGRDFRLYLALYFRRNLRPYLALDLWSDLRPYLALDLRGDLRLNFRLTDLVCVFHRYSPKVMAPGALQNTPSAFFPA